MKKLFGVLVAAMLVSPAMAAKDFSINSAAQINPNSGGPRATAYGTGFEAPDFALADIDGQAGWNTFSTNLNQIVSSANAFAGSQHYRMVAEDTLALGANVGAFSPDLGPQNLDPVTLSVEVNISNSFGADYYIQPQAPSQGFLTTIMRFNYYGNIYYVTDPGTGPAYVDSGVAWVPGEYKNATIAMNQGANTIDYYYDGALIGTGTVWAGTAIEEVLLKSDNYQLGGETADWDNLNITPEPATLALLVLGGFAAIRRRR